MTDVQAQTAPVEYLRHANVAFLVRYPYRHLVLAMVEAIREVYDVSPHIFVERPDHAAFFRAALGDQVSLSVAPSTEVDLKSAVHLDMAAKATLVERCRALEKAAGETLSQIAMADRVWGHAFALAGIYGPRHKDFDAAPYEAMLQGTLNSVQAWRNLINDRGIKLALVFMGPAVAKHLAIACRLEGAAFRVLSSSRLRNLHSWFQDEFYESNILEDRFAVLAEALQMADVDEAAPDQIGYTESAIAWRFYTSTLGKPVRIVRDLLHAGAKQARHRLSPVGIPQASMVAALAAALRPHIAYLQQVRLAGGADLTGLSERPFVFFPLQLEPEPALSQLSPEVFDQLAVIAVIARDLPAGVMLVVKEHLSALGRRPKDFYRQIRQFKNVLLVAPTIPGAALIQGALAVATLNSTAGMEAVGLGKPVVTWGRHNMYNFLPDVHLLDLSSSAAPVFRRILEEGARHDAARNGRLFLQAIEDVSFDLGAYNVVDHFDVTMDQGRAMVAILNWTLRADGLA